MSRDLPLPGTPARYQLEQRAGRRPSPEDCEANAARVRETYHSDPRARELSAERGRRYRERQRAARQAQVDAWVQSVIAPPKTAPVTLGQQNGT